MVSRIVGFSNTAYLLMVLSNNLKFTIRYSHLWGLAVGRTKINNASGLLQISFLNERHEICHEISIVSLQERQKADVVLCLQRQDSSAYSWARVTKNNGKEIRKIILGRRDVPVFKVVKEVSKFYDGGKKHLVAARLQLPNHSEAWLNPVLVEKLGEIERAKEKLNAVKNSGGIGVNFHAKTVKLLEAELTVDFGERPERLTLELQNFKSAFELC